MNNQKLLDKLESLDSTAKELENSIEDIEQESTDFLECLNAHDKDIEKFVLEFLTDNEELKREYLLMTSEKHESTLNYISNLDECANETNHNLNELINEIDKIRLEVYKNIG